MGSPKERLRCCISSCFIHLIKYAYRCVLKSTKSSSTVAFFKLIKDNHFFLMILGQIFFSNLETKSHFQIKSFLLTDAIVKNNTKHCKTFVTSDQFILFQYPPAVRILLCSGCSSPSRARFLPATGTRFCETPWCNVTSSVDDVMLLGSPDPGGPDGVC